jgi:hypothetical protein
MAGLHIAVQELKQLMLPTDLFSAVMPVPVLEGQPTLITMAKM